MVPWSGVLGDEGNDAIYAGNITIRMQLRMDDPLNHGNTGMYFRATRTGDYYNAGIYLNQLYLARMTAWTWTVLKQPTIPGFSPAQQDIIIQIDVTDFTDSTGGRTSRLEVYGWLPGQNKPAQPQISVVDGTFAQGGVAMYADRCSATFRWVEVVAEPTEPIVDFNGDGTVDENDLEILMEYWDQNVDDPTLLAHWALDETEGTIAYDSAGTNDASVIGELIWEPTGGQVDGALQLDGVDDCIITDSVLNPAEGPFSVLAWVKGGAAGQVIVSEPTANWLCTDPSNGELTTELACQGQATIPLISETIITDGEWHRIGFVWDGSDRMLYVDDVIVAQDTQADLKQSDSGLNIGTGKAMELGAFWSGLIDDIRIYSRAVSP
ncbi:MAG TPA: LamG domain-containing protein [Sedimentisphaerales bacterium]|nr:LamG domain-containing protein [Sedimentisphaerales bacterium]